MSACELQSLQGPQTMATSVPRGCTWVQSSAVATSTKHTKTTKSEEEASSEAEVEPQAMKKAIAKGKGAAKGKGVAKGKNARYVTYFI